MVISLNNLREIDMFNPKCIVFVTCVVLAACAENKGSINDDFGNAYYNNMSVHIINPHPTIYENAPDLEGRRSSETMQRYFKGKTKELERERASKIK